MGMHAVSQRGLYGLKTWRECEMMLATISDPELSVVFSSRYGCHYCARKIL